MDDYMSIFDSCSCEGCTSRPLRIIKVINAGYCNEHWKEVAGSLNHYPVLKIYPCPYCRWIFSREFVLNRHIDEKHREMR